MPDRVRYQRHDDLAGMPFDDMRVGDSFLVPMDEGDDKGRKLAALRMRVSRYNTSNTEGKRFSVVREEGGYRVFRTN